MRSHVLLASCTVAALASSAATAGEQWVASVKTSSQWAVFPCTSWLVTSVCGTDKDYSDHGTLPSVVAVGDTITYTDQKGREKSFVVRHIRVFVYDNDVDFTQGAQRVRAKKGDTDCTLYDVRSRADTADSNYPSKVVIKQCRLLQ
jgi:hypothetical protein